MPEMPLRARAEASICCSEEGRQIAFSEKQPESALAPIRASFDPNSNVNDESAVHSEKELSPRNSTEAGRQIDFNDEQRENAPASIRASFDPNLDVNDESAVHSEKELSPRNSTEAGRQIDSNDEQ
jgi:hypothetical protein